MLRQRLSQFKLLVQHPRFGFGKDYYALLGISKNATQDEINKAYTDKAKIFYPDVNTAAQQINNESAVQFQDIAEAYSVLSVQQSRNVYDLMKKQQPNLIYAQDRDALNRSQEKQEDGNVKKVVAGAKAGSWAEERRQWLADERKRFNVDELGRYRGGLPQRDRPGYRGKALGQIGEFHHPILHEEKTNPVQSELVVNGTMVDQFKVWAHDEKLGKQWKYLHQEATVDYDYFNLNPVKNFWNLSRNIFLLVIAFPWLITLFVKHQNNQITNEIYELIQQGKSIEGAIVGGFKVIVGKTGTLKLTELTDTHHH